MIDIYKRNCLFATATSMREAGELTGLHQQSVANSLLDGNARKGFTFKRDNGYVSKKKPQTYIVTIDGKKHRCEGMKEVCELTGYTVNWVYQIIKNPNNRCHIVRL